MKTIVLFIAAIFSLNTVNGQFTQNFESTETALTGNCWTLLGVYKTTNPADVITGTGSMYTNPPTNSSSTRDIATPALNITSTSFTVSFNYKVSSKISGNATRTIEVGLSDAAGTFTSLALIILDKNSPITVLNFNQTFTLASTGYRKLVLRLGGSTGDGNSRLIFDDLYASANALYGSGTCNSAPIAVNDVFSGLIGSVISGNITNNDSDPNEEMITPVVVVTSLDGVVVLNANGNFTFTPAPGFIGLQTIFTYQLTDNGLDPMTSNIATVTLNFISPINLPIKLTSFTATLNNSKADLKWVTASEINVSHFVIERSLDGTNFSDAGMVFAYGNATDETNYSFSDNLATIAAPVVYYRLRSVDVDGKAEYSAIRMIRIGKERENNISILTYPNPVQNELRITIPAAWQNKNVSYEIFSANGQVVRNTKTNSSSQTETINVNTLAPGLYIVKATCGTESAQQKIVKQ